MLDKQVVSIPFTKGIDTKTDEKLVIPGALALAENAVFTKQGQVKKRNGYDALVKSYTLPKGMSDFGNELLAFANDRVYSYSENNTEWIDKGFCQNVVLDVENYGTNIDRSFGQSFAKGDSIYATVYSGKYYDVSLNAFYTRFFISVKDHSTDAFYLQNYSISANITLSVGDLACRIEYIDGLFVVFYNENNNLYFRTFSESTPNVVSSATLVSNVYANGLRVKNSGTKLIVSFVSPAGVEIYRYNNIAVLEASTTHIDGVITQSTIHYKNGQVWIAYCIGGTPVTKLAIYTLSTLTQVGANVVITNTLLLQLSLCDIDATHVWLVGGQVGGVIMAIDVNSAGATSSLVTLFNSSFILSENYTVEDRQYLNIFTTEHISRNVPSAFENPLNGYVVNKTGNVVCTFAREAIGVDDGAGYSISDVKVSGSKASFASAKVISAPAATDTTIKIPVNLLSYELDFNPDENINTKKLGNLLYTTGGYLGLYDGKGFSENGFFEYPSNVQAAVGAAGNIATLSTDEVLWSAVYEWKDNQGNLHQSAQKINNPLVLPNGSNYFTVIVPRLELTTEYKEDSVYISLYRTPVNQEVSYLVFSCPNNIANGSFVGTTTQARGISAKYVQFLDNISDTNLVYNQILYTAGGVLENFIPPAPKYLEIFKNRLVVVSSDSSVDMIWYSKNFAYGFGVGFNEALTLLVNPIGGSITGLKFMDDKLLIFKENLLYGLGGDGANDLGANNTFSQPEIISSDVGCITQNSLVLMPLGVMFMSNKGIYLCSRQLQIEYIGKGAEDFNHLTVMSGDLLQDVNQIRFLTRDGVLLLYDYFFDNWGTFTNHQGIDATIWRGVYTYMRTDGTIYTESASGLDNDVIFKMKIRTAWLKFAGIQGFQRVRRFAFLGGDLESGHILKISIRYDYEQYDSDSIIFDATQLLSTSYGSGNYGDMSVYGGDDNGVYQFRGHMPRQKCESVQFTFEDISGVEAKETYSISDLSLEVGLKRGLNKMKITRTVG